MYCIQCGTRLPDTARFCADCGVPVQAAAATPTPIVAPSNPYQAPPRKTGTTCLQALLRFAAGIILVIGAIVLGVFAYFMFFSAPKTGLLAVAIRQSGEAAMYGYVGDPARTPFRVPPGVYYVEVTDQNGRVAVLSKTEVPPGGALPLPRDLERGGVKSGERAQDLKAVARFLSGVDRLRLTYLSGASGGFKAPLFDSKRQPGPTDLKELQDRASALAAQKSGVAAAIDRIETRAAAASSVRYASVGIAPSSGVFGKIKDKLLSFFGYLGDAGKRARERIIKISAELSPEDKQDAFDSVRQEFRGGAKNFDEFIEVLRSGKLDTQGAQIESDMRNAPGFGATAKTSGAGVGDIFHEEGGQMVTKGAEFNVQVIKTVLGDVFPDITEGFDLADKAAEWAEYAEEVYRNPLGNAEEAGRDWVKDKISERIKSDLTKYHPGIPEEVAERIADVVSEKVVDAVPPMASDGPSTPTPERRPLSSNDNPAKAPTVTPSPPTKTPTRIAPAASPTRVLPSPTPAEPFSVFVLTNAAEGLYIGTEDSLKGRTRCSFEGGGNNCQATDLVTYKQLLGPFPTRSEAEAALCKSITERKVFPLGIGLKGRWQGSDTWYGLWDRSVLTSCKP